ncbi:MAG: hypothetical protein FWH28_02420 [Clostridiales bacterium]|nr:hypothetical protein [Clostridiales bacterium]
MRAGQEKRVVKWAVEGMVKGFAAEYPMTGRHTSVAGDMLVSRKAREQS